MRTVSLNTLVFLVTFDIAAAASTTHMLPLHEGVRPLQAISLTAYQSTAPFLRARVKTGGASAVTKLLMEMNPTETAEACKDCTEAQAEAILKGEGLLKSEARANATCTAKSRKAVEKAENEVILSQINGTILSKSYELKAGISELNASKADIITDITIVESKIANVQSVIGSLAFAQTVSRAQLEAKSALYNAMARLPADVAAMLVDDKGEKWLGRLEAAEDELIEKRLAVLRAVAVLATATKSNKTLLDQEKALLEDKERQTTNEIAQKEAEKATILSQLTARAGEAEEHGTALQNELDGLVRSCTTANADVIAQSKPKMEADHRAFEKCKTLMATLSWTSSTGPAPSASPNPTAPSAPWPPRPPNSWADAYQTCNQDDVLAFFGKVTPTCQEEFQVMMKKPSNESKIAEDILIICPCLDDVTIDDMKELAQKRTGPLLCKPTPTSAMTSFDMWKYCRERAGRDVIDSEDLAFGKPLE